MKMLSFFQAHIERFDRHIANQEMMIGLQMEVLAILRDEQEQKGRLRQLSIEEIESRKVHMRDVERWWNSGGSPSYEKDAAIIGRSNG